MTHYLKHSFTGICLLFVLFVSCGTPKRSIYFRTDTPLDTTAKRLTQLPTSETIVKSDDILAINVTSSSSITEGVDPVIIYNEGGTSIPSSAISGGTSRNTNTGKGYLVDQDGFIDFPVVGKLAVGGMTIRQVKEILQQKLSNMINNPVVEVRIMNYKVIMLGEVNAPGVVIAPGHGLNILEAIAAAGDVRFTGRKDNVMVIRQENGTKKMVRLNLNSSEVFHSPYFELKQNDIVYVEPNRLQRSQNSEFLKLYLPSIASVTSTILAVYGVVQIAKTQK